MNRLNQSQQSQALVVEGQKLRGIISLKDLMKYISLKMELESDEPASMSPAA
jgi:CBS domain-containing protein